MRDASFFCWHKKSETLKPRLKCFHNGIILIVIRKKMYSKDINNTVSGKENFLFLQKIYFV